MPEHHLPEDLLAEYASGAVDEGKALLVACHATLCPSCRARIADFEDLGGAWLSSGEDTPIAGVDPASKTEVEDVIAAVLDRAASDASKGEVIAGATERPDVRGDGVLPGPLFELVGPLDRIAWQRPLPGLEVLSLEGMGMGPHARLTRVRANATVAKHDHVGREFDLVLMGGLEDLTRGDRFERGDIQAGHAGVTHELRSLPGEPCLVLTVNEGPVVPKSLRARLIYRWLRWS